jgi:argininosuccinate synthase
VKDMFRMTVAPEDAPDSATFLRIEFVAGIPSKIINKTTGAEFTDPLEGFNHLNEVAGNASKESSYKNWCPIGIFVL